MEQASRINLSSLGTPAVILEDANKDKTEMALGQIVGLMDGVAFRKQPTGDGFYAGLKGDFITRPATGNEAKPVRAKLLYLPQQIQASLVAMYFATVNYDTGETTDTPDATRPKSPVEVALNVMAVRSGAKGNWKVIPILEAKEIESPDFMSALTKKVDDAVKNTAKANAKK